MKKKRKGKKKKKKKTPHILEAQVVLGPPLSRALVKEVSRLDEGFLFLITSLKDGCVAEMMLSFECRGSVIGLLKPSLWI